MTNIESILSAISREGWQVRAMGQLSPSRWYAVLHRFEDDGIYITPDRSADTLAFALGLAYEAIACARWLPYATPKAEAQALDLAALGLLKPKVNTFNLTARFRR